MRFLILFIPLFLIGDEIKEGLLKIWDDISKREYKIVMEKLKDCKKPNFEIKKDSKNRFNICMKDNEIVYIKRDCLDKEPTFFLHIYPKNSQKYINLDFLSTELFYYKNFCIGYKKIPSVNFSKIETGQFIKNERVWEIDIKP